MTTLMKVRLMVIGIKIIIKIMTKYTQKFGPKITRKIIPQHTQVRLTENMNLI